MLESTFVACIVSQLPSIGASRVNFCQSAHRHRLLAHSLSSISTSRIGATHGATVQDGVWEGVTTTTQ